jgi:hypothetical protein
MAVTKILWIIGGILILVVIFVIVILPKMNQSQQVIQQPSEEGIISQAGELASPSTIASGITSKAWRFNITGKEQYLDPEVRFINGTLTEICIEVDDEDAYVAAAAISNHDPTKVPINKTDPKDNSFSITKADFSVQAKGEKDKCFNINYPEWKVGMEIKIGWDSIIGSSTDEGEGLGLVSGNHRVFYDPNNDRIHVLYISNSDIHTNSTSDGGATWSSGAVWVPGNFDYNDLDCVLNLDGTLTFLDCMFAVGAVDAVDYRRLNLTGSSPYVAFGLTFDTIFDSSARGGQTSDDVYHPKVTLGEDECLYVMFGMEDASEDTVDEHEVFFTKEGGVCDNNDWDSADAGDTDFTIESVQTDALGYQEDISIMLGRYLDSDDHLLGWIDIDDFSNVEYEIIFFNGTTQTMGTQFTIENDGEAATVASPNSIVIVQDTDEGIFFGGDDQLDPVYGWRNTIKNTNMTTRVDTGARQNPTTFYGGLSSAIVDTIADPDVVWVFLANGSSRDQIVYTNSTDGGATWYSPPVLWFDGDGEEQKFISTHFSNITCNISVTWVSGTSSPWNISFDILDTGSCVAAPPAVIDKTSCNYTLGDGNWDVNCTDDCFIQNITNIMDNDLILNSTGTFSVGALVHNVSSIIKDDDCIVVKNNTGEIRVT